MWGAAGFVLSSALNTIADSLKKSNDEKGTNTGRGFDKGKRNAHDDNDVLGVQERDGTCLLHCILKRLQHGNTPQMTSEGMRYHLLTDKTFGDLIDYFLNVKIDWDYAGIDETCIDVQKAIRYSVEQATNGEYTCDIWFKPFVNPRALRAVAMDNPQIISYWTGPQTRHALVVWYDTWKTCTVYDPWSGGLTTESWGNMGRIARSVVSIYPTR